MPSVGHEIAELQNRGTREKRPERYAQSRELITAQLDERFGVRAARAHLLLVTRARQGLEHLDYLGRTVPW